MPAYIFGVNNNKAIYFDLIIIDIQIECITSSTHAISVKPQKCPHFQQNSHFVEWLGFFQCQSYIVTRITKALVLCLWNVVESLWTRHNTIKQFTVGKCGRFPKHPCSHCLITIRCMTCDLLFRIGCVFLNWAILFVFLCVCSFLT